MHSLAGGESVVQAGFQEAVPRADGVHLDPGTLLRAERALYLTPDPRRNRALLHLTIAFGCIPADLAGLRLEDVDLTGGRIRWRRAAGLAAPLSRPLVDDLRDYLERERRGRSSQLFLTRLGHPLTARTLALLFRRLGREVGSGQLSPAALRQRRLRLLRAAGGAAPWLRHGLLWLYLADPSPLADPARPGAGAGDGAEGLTRS